MRASQSKRLRTLARRITNETGQSTEKVYKVLKKRFKAQGKQGLNKKTGQGVINTI